MKIAGVENIQHEDIRHHVQQWNVFPSFIDRHNKCFVQDPLAGRTYWLLINPNDIRVQMGRLAALIAHHLPNDLSHQHDSPLFPDYSSNPVMKEYEFWLRNRPYSLLVFVWEDLGNAKNNDLDNLDASAAVLQQHVGADNDSPD